MNDQYVARVIDLTDPARNRIHNMTLEQARERVTCGDASRAAEIDGSFALVGREGKRVRLARSLDIATSSPSRRPGRCSSSPTASTRSTTSS
jgi:hypothetical protein